jgi:sugar phosphate isomerase/epimerase
MAAFFTLSAFADEISPDPQVQLAVLEKSGVRHIELRSIYGTNVLSLTDQQVRDFKRLLDERGFRLSAIGSPIGKVKITEPWEPHWQRFLRAVELAQLFGTPNIRLFSYYKPDDGSTWDTHRNAILDRLQQKVERAAQARVRLLHENEANIYGEAPNRVRDLLATINHPQFRAAYDAANYVHMGHDPLEGWRLTKDWTTHFHIKDWIHGQERGVLAGTGQGQWSEVLAEAAQNGYQGFATLEPHLLGGGPTGGVTGPDLFPKAIQAFRGILDRIGAAHD